MSDFAVSSDGRWGSWLQRRTKSQQEDKGVDLMLISITNTQILTQASSAQFSSVAGFPQCYIQNNVGSSAIWAPGAGLFLVQSNKTVTLHDPTNVCLFYARVLACVYNLFYLFSFSSSLKDAFVRAEYMLCLFLVVSHTCACSYIIYYSTRRGSSTPVPRVSHTVDRRCGKH